MGRGDVSLIISFVLVKRELHGGSLSEVGSRHDVPYSLFYISEHRKLAPRSEAGRDIASVAVHYPGADFLTSPRLTMAWASHTWLP